MEVLCKGNSVLAGLSMPSRHHRSFSVQFTKTLRVMKLVTAAMFIFCVHVSARTVSQTVTLTGKAIPLQKVFSAIKSQTGYLFFYRNEDLTGTTPVSLQLKAVPVPQALATILQDQPLSYSIQGNTIFITPRNAVVTAGASQAAADTATPVRVVHGVVYSEEGYPMEGASVHVLETRAGMSTTSTGEFRLAAAPGATLIISNVGYAPTHLRVKQKDNEFSVRLIHAENKLDQVQVIAYGTTVRGLLTSPISTVKAKDIQNFPLGSFDQMLQGLAPGVFVSANSGSPGKMPYLNIRGRNSIIGNSPLYIVDGLPVLSDAFGDDGVGLDPLIGLNPGDIESIEILKDAGSTAIYGSRAAGGVVLVTTKRGRQGKSNISFTGTQGAGIPTGRLHLLNTRDYVALRREGFMNDNPGKPLPADLASLDSTTETNWQNLVYKPTMISEYKLSASGGDAVTQFYMSGGFRKETNALSGKKGLDRETFRVNLDHQEGKRLKLSASVGASRTGDQNTADGSTTYSAVAAGVTAPPDVKPYDSLGNFTPIPLPSGIVGNPLAIFAVKMDNVITQLKTSASINYEILDGLSFHTDMGYDYNNVAGKIYIPKAVNATLQNVLYDAEIHNTLVNTYSLEPQFRLNKKWSTQNMIEAVAGTTFQKSKTTINTLFGKGFPSDDVQEMGAASTTFGSSSNVTYAFNSLFGRVNYIRSSRYIINASFRRDGSSRFGPDNRFGDFWAVSGGWVFSRESFARNWHFLSSGKLRSSYGVVGNDGIGDFSYIDLWQPYPYGNQPGTRPITAESPDVKWERTAKFDAGVDLGFLNDRIGVTVNYFDNRTDNLLVTKPVPSQTGFTQVQDNLPGQVRNNGVELEFNSVNIRSSDFQWSMKLNLTWQQNILNAFPGLVTNPAYNQHYAVGKTLNLLWGYRFQGVDPKTGNPMYDGFNTDGTVKDPTAINPGYQIIGNFTPKYFGGWLNNFTWKRFSLDVFLQFVQGVDAINDQFDLNSSSVYSYNQVTDVLGRWKNSGDVTNVPRSATLNSAWWITSNIDKQSSRFLSDGSYLRVKNVTLAYLLPPRTLTHLRMKEMRIYASAQNLALFTHYKGIDPETGGNVAPTRMIVGGINLSF